MPEPAAPDWITDAVRRTWDELQLYRATALAFTLHPGRSAREWGAGERQALNPLGMLATAAGLLGTSRSLFGQYVGASGGEGGSSLVESVLESAAPFIHYALLGLFCHAVLIVFVGRRRKLRDSVGLALFAGAGPALITSLACYGAGALIWVAASRPKVVAGGLFGALSGPARLALFVFAVGGFSAFCAAFVAAMSALHEARVWQTLLAFTCALLLAGLVLGLFPGLPFGTRVVLKLSPPGINLWLD